MHLRDRQKPAKTGRAGAGPSIKPGEVTLRQFKASRVDNPGPRADGGRPEPGGWLRRKTIL